MGFYEWTWDDWCLRAAYTLLISIADFLEDWFFPLKERKDPPSCNADRWSDDETLRKLRDRTFESNQEGKFRQIDERTGVKVLHQLEEGITAVQNHEALAIQLVREHTRIPVPRLYQIWSHPLEEQITYLIMDFVKGKRLDHAWPKLSWLARARVAWTLRSYIRQLRKIETDLSRVPGPLGPRPLHYNGYSYVFVAKPGLFSDAASMFAHIESYHKPGQTKKPAVFEGFDKPQPLVLTHGDMCGRNVVLGDDGQVWLIDWGFSGFYPDFFEYMSMSYAAKRDPVKVPLSWRLCIPFISDPHRARELWVSGCGY